MDSATADFYTTDFYARFCGEWLEAWNSGDAQRVLDLMTPDCEYIDSGWPTVMSNHEEAETCLAHMFEAFPDAHLERVGGVMIDPERPRASFRWLLTGTHSGTIEPPGLTPTGKRISVQGTDVHEYEDGKVANLWINWDLSGLLRQLGVLPEMHSKTERMMAHMNRGKNLFGLLGR